MPDLPTTVVVETTYIASVYNTFTAPTSTEIDSYYMTVTSTMLVLDLCRNRIDH